MGEINRIPDEGYVASPKYTSVKQKIEEQKQEARRNLGLTNTIEDPKAAVGELSLKFISSPVPNSLSELKKLRADDNFTKLRSLEPNFEKH